MFIQNSTRKAKSQGPSSDMPPIIIPTADDDGSKVIDAEFHTLFISDEDPIGEEIEIEHNGEIITAVKEVVPKHKKFTLYIETFGHMKNQLHKVLNELRKGKEHDILEIRIDSPGGFVSEGITLYNLMKELFMGRVTTYVDSTAFSMGAMLFSLGDERVAYEDSSLMYHNYSTGYGGKGGEIKAYIDYEDRHFDEFFTNKIVRKGFLSADEYARMKDGKDFWIDSLEMSKRGICTHVVVGGFKLDTDAYIEYREQSDTIENWAIMKLKEQLVDIESEESDAKAEATADADKKAKRAAKAKARREAKKKGEEAERNPKSSSKPKDKIIGQPIHLTQR